MKCLLLHCHEELAQLTALTLIVGVGWIELWECPNHGVWSIPKGETMKEVRCNRAGACKAWCHAATPHPVSESCERSYCREVRRQVKCEPVTVRVSINERMRAYMDAHPEGPFAGKAISLLLEATPKPARPELTPETKEAVALFYRLLEEQRAGQGSADDLVLKVNTSLDSEPMTMTTAVYESSVRAIIGKVISDNLRVPIGWPMVESTLATRQGIADRATAEIMKLPRIRQEGGTGE